MNHLPGGSKGSRPGMNVPENETVKNKNLFGARCDVGKTDAFHEGVIELLGVRFRINFKAGDFRAKAHLLNFPPLALRIWLESHSDKSMFQAWTRQPWSTGQADSRVQPRWADLSLPQLRPSVPSFVRTKTCSVAKP